MKEASHIQGDTTHSPLRVSPSLAMSLIICLSFIVLNNFFANMCVKKNCASPTKSHTARNCQGHSRKCSPNQKKNKKGLQKSFSGNLQFIGVARILIGRAQITNHVQWRHQNFSKEELFAGQRYHRMEDLKPLLVGTKPGFCKERGLKLIVEKCKYLTLKTCWES